MPGIGGICLGTASRQSNAVVQAGERFLYALSHMGQMRLLCLQFWWSARLQCMLCCKQAHVQAPAWQAVGSCFDRPLKLVARTHSLCALLHVVMLLFCLFFYV